MSTYSLSVTASGAGIPFVVTNIQVDDAYANSPAEEAQAMSDGAVFLAKGPDGGLYPAVYDTERCIPGVRRVVRRYR